MSRDILQFDSADICERLVGITSTYLNNFLQRGQFGLKASIQSGQVRAKHRRFSREDVFGIALAWLLFEAGLRTDPIIRVLKEIAETKTANANAAAKKLLDLKADFLVICRLPRKPVKHALEKPDQSVQFVQRSQLTELVQKHLGEEILVIPVGAKFADIENRVALLY
jgi:hypothetical protein